MAALLDNSSLPVVAREKSARRSNTSIEQTFQKFFAIDFQMIGDIAENGGERTDFQRAMCRDRYAVNSFMLR